MGDMADNLVDDGITWDIEAENIPYTWRTKDGKVMTIADMTTRHIHNVMIHLTRRNKGNLIIYRELQKEYKRRTGHTFIRIL